MQLEKIQQGPSLLFYLVTAPFLPLLIPVFVLLFIFKTLLKLVLISKHGKRFGGFLASPDTLWTHERNEWRCVVNVLFLLECQDRIDLKQKLTVFDVNDYPKLKATVHKSCGYYYFVNDDVDLTDCAKVLRVPKDRPFDDDALRDIVSEMVNEPLPKNGAGMWEFRVSESPLVAKRNGKHAYPVIFRFNHVVGDGATFISFFMKVFSDTQADQYLTTTLKKYSGLLTQTSNDFNLVIWFGRIKSILRNLYVLFFIFGTLLHLLFARESDENPLHGPCLCGDKIVAWSVEDKEELIPTVKKIKNKFPKMAFSEVVHTALVASLTDFYKRNGYGVPNYISVGMPFIMSVRDMLKPGPVTLVNKFSFGIATFPTRRATLIQTLLEVKERFEILKSGIEIEVAFIIMEYFMGLLPAFCVKIVSTLPGMTAIVTSLPGTAKVTFGNTAITSVTFYAPNRMKTGLTISILTYDDRFQIGLEVDKALIASKTEAQIICEDIFKYLKLLDAETSSLGYNEI
ncbi:uncharacterized protein LOC132707206 isoform X2 [Cylas formicarius]|uniref:uncharacterized protein LOC132707206 isoform X2 n=1 Tax=Cylas formicarius TaxID=197179 RepID=UPI002958705B|nr:uncharacterized protein LOC132707206 isoform X2 [Cylas formicarius]